MLPRIGAKPRRALLDTKDRSGDTQGPWLEVDLAALQRNARRFAEGVGVRLLPMVKADGYGLGAVAVARALEPVGPWGFGVALLAEARALRREGIQRPIVAFDPYLSDDSDDYIAADVRPSIADLEGLERWTARTPAAFHLSIETGMGRGGIRWDDQKALDQARAVLATSVGFEGAYTHFHSADESSEATEVQWTRFQQSLVAIGGAPPLTHAANSAAAQWGGRFAGSLARPGIYLYGGQAGRLAPEPVATLSARIVSVAPARPGDTVSYGATHHVREACDIVTLAIGYADGVHRTLGSSGSVAIGGTAYPIVGRVTMDMTMAAVPPGTARVGQRAVLFGPELSLDDQAAAAGTISYELLTAVGPRVHRHYRGTP